jgi:hypothetical protein
MTQMKVGKYAQFLVVSKMENDLPLSFKDPLYQIGVSINLNEF